MSDEKNIKGSQNEELSTDKTDKKAVKEGEAEPKKERKKLTKTQIFLIVFGAVAFIAILATVITVLIVGRDFNYMKRNLSKYVYVAEEHYKSYNVKIDIPEITDFDIDEKIVKLLCAYKEKPNKAPYNIPGVTLSAGDVANIYYRGYTVEDGVKSYFDGGCNFAGDYTALEIGSGSFVPGFESGLVGKNGDDYATFEKITSGKIQSDYIVNLTYSVISSDHSSRQNQTVLLDLTDPTIDEKWGDGFKAALLNKQMGKYFATGLTADGVKDEEIMVSAGDVSYIYYNLKVDLACKIDDSEKEKLEIKAYFPSDYKAEDLRGKEGFFEVYIISAQDYKAPEYNDEFITEKLKLTAEDLKDYEGETLSDKYRGCIREVLNAERDAEIETAKADAFWDHIMSVAEFKKLPKKEVERHYKETIEEFTATYESNYADSYSLDDFMIGYLSLAQGTDWKAYIREQSEASVKQRLVFYYIVQADNIVPSNEEKINEKALYEYFINEIIKRAITIYS